MAGGRKGSGYTYCPISPATKHATTVEMRLQVIPISCSLRLNNITVERS